MSDGNGNSASHRRSSRRRYQGFVEDYKLRRLDDLEDGGEDHKQLDGSEKKGERPAPESKRKRREYLREYMRWLRPHRYAVVAVFFLALVAAGLEMGEPLFMRFIVDRVLLNSDLDLASRLSRLHLTGLLFVGVVVVSKLIATLKDYRQRLLNVHVMLSLRQSLFERLLHLPLPKLWDMKTGGILSRLTGDVDTTTGLLQMAFVSPAVSVIRLVIAVSTLR